MRELLDGLKTTAILLLAIAGVAGCVTFLESMLETSLWKTTAVIGGVLYVCSHLLDSSSTMREIVFSRSADLFGFVKSKWNPRKDEPVSTKNRRGFSEIFGNMPLRKVDFTTEKVEQPSWMKDPKTKVEKPIALIPVVGEKSLREKILDYLKDHTESKCTEEVAAAIFGLRPAIYCSTDKSDNGETYWTSKKMFDEYWANHNDKCETCFNELMMLAEEKLVEHKPEEVGGTDLWKLVREVKTETKEPEVAHV